MKEEKKLHEKKLSELMEDILDDDLIDVTSKIVEVNKWAKAIIKDYEKNRNYATVGEMLMDEQFFDLQMVLGIQSCKTKGEVASVLKDVRKHAIIKFLKEKF